MQRIHGYLYSSFNFDANHRLLARFTQGLTKLEDLTPTRFCFGPLFVWNSVLFRAPLVIDTKFNFDEAPC